MRKLSASGACGKGKEGHREPARCLVLCGEGSIVFHLTFKADKNEA